MSSARRERESRSVERVSAELASAPLVHHPLQRAHGPVAFVFALQMCRKPTEYDALDVGQWRFWVAPAGAVAATGYRSVGMNFLKERAPGPVEWSELGESIRRVSQKGEAS